MIAFTVNEGPYHNLSNEMHCLVLTLAISKSSKSFTGLKESLETFNIYIYIYIYIYIGIQRSTQ